MTLSKLSADIGFRDAAEVLSEKAFTCINVGDPAP